MLTPLFPVMIFSQLLRIMQICQKVIWRITRRERQAAMLLLNDEIICITKTIGWCLQSFWRQSRLYEWSSWSWSSWSSSSSSSSSSSNIKPSSRNKSTTVTYSKKILIYCLYTGTLHCYITTYVIHLYIVFWIDFAFQLVWFWWTCIVAR